MSRNPKSVLAALLACAAHGVCLATPVTASKWSVEIQCSSDQASGSCEDYSSEIQIWKIDDELCGTINQTTARRSPDGWFAGRRQDDRVLVRFVDTFQYSGDGVGTALIDFGKDKLTWTVLSTAEGQRIHSEARYHPALKIDPPDTQDVSSCAELESRMSATTVRMPKL